MTYIISDNISVYDVVLGWLQNLRQVLLLVILFMVFSTNVFFGQDTSEFFLKIESDQELPFYNNDFLSLKTIEDVNNELEKIKKIAQDNNYLEFSIDSLINVNDTVKAIVHRGDIYIVSEYLVNVISDDSVANKANDSRWIGNEFGLISLREIEQKLLLWYDNNGYPFAQIELDELDKTESGLIARLNLKTGAHYKIDSIIVKSDAKLNLRLVQNRIGIKQGEQYNGEKIREIYNRINEVNYLALERDPEVLFTKNEAVLYLYLKKKSSNNINGLIGFLPDDNGKIEFTGNLELQLTNAFGGDEFIDFNWRKLQQSSQDLKINFSYPYLFNLNVGFEQGLSIYKHDTTYTEVKSKSSLQYLFGRFKNLGLFVQSHTYNSLNNTEVGEANPESSIVQYGVSGQWSNLDYRFNPRRGVDLKMNVAVGDKKLQGAGTLVEESNVKNVQTLIEGYVHYYLPIKKRSVLKISANSAHIENDFVIENELFRLGGVRSIRGFDEEAISASSYVIGGLEYRFLTDINSYFNAFGDYAIYEKKTIENTSLIAGNALGIGVGAAFETKAGIFSISYAIGRINDDPFLLKSGKIHFGFSAIF